MSIDYGVREHIAYITLNKPEKANILDREHIELITEVWKDAWEDREVRAVIITGAGDRHFCAGHDLQVPDAVSSEDRQFNRVREQFWPLAGTVNGTPLGADGHLGDHYPQIWKPVIGAVNGWAAGAGLILTLACMDIRVACADHARFKFGLFRLGGLGGAPAATLLLRQLRYIDAMRFLFHDDGVDAAEAREMGLINESVPCDQLLPRAEAIAREIVAMPPIALRMMKEFANRYADTPFDQKWQIQAMTTGLLHHMTADADEGVAAFNEKRQANFTGILRRRGESFATWTPEDWGRLDDLRRRQIW